jgi:ABC-2 type transport system permease protein
MKRFWILLRTELKAWSRDPISAVGGFIAPCAMLAVFGLLFGGRLTLSVAVLNHDRGPWGEVLQQTVTQVLSPFGTPYYDVVGGDEGQVWSDYERHMIDGVWVLPEDFSARVEAGDSPQVVMHFDNYNDDRAKNHRIYVSEILWQFYESVGYPSPPLALTEEYPRSEMVAWFPLIAVGLVLFGVTLGSVFNVFMLTYKEQVARITLELGLAPRSLVWALLPKVLLALVMGVLTGTALMGILRLWLGVWPGRYLMAVWLLTGLMALFWIALALVLGLRARHYLAGPLAAVLGGAIVFFVGGGLAPVRYFKQDVVWLAWLFPNTYAVDPIRDLVLFQSWPADWTPTLLILLGFAALGLTAGLGMAARQLRRIG